MKGRRENQRQNAESAGKTQPRMAELGEELDVV